MLVDCPYWVVCLSAVQPYLAYLRIVYQHNEIKWRNFIYLLVPRTLFKDTVISSDHMALNIWVTKNN
jgi:hypothetical protein